MKKVIERLNKIQADAHALFVAFHDYHWNVKGMQFFQIHDYTDEAYEEMATLFDDMAERALQLGGKAIVKVDELTKLAKAPIISKTAYKGDEVLSAMKKAYEMAGKPKIDYVNAHGTSTSANDKNETAALKELFGNAVPPVSSTKGQTGHCLGAAGAIEAVVSLLAMKEGILPPTINQISKDPECDLDYIPNVARKAQVDIVMSNSFGFGGTNGSVIFKRV